VEGIRGVATPTLSRRTSGAALVVVVLITLALFGIGHGLLSLALGELAASRAGARHLEARTAAESAIHRALADTGQAWQDSLPVDGERLVGSWSWGRAEATASAWRLAPESWWLEGVGHVGVGTTRTARLAWALDPLARTLALDATLTVGWSAPVVIDGLVEAGSASTGDPALDSSCVPWLQALDASYDTDPLDALASLAPADTLPALGILGFEELLGTAILVPSGSGTPAPVESLGECVRAEPWNWGDPEHAWRACGAYFPLRGSRGDLRLDGGVGQGLLVVDGDLDLAAGARFHGLALVRGALRVANGAELVGMAVAVGGAFVAANGRVRGWPCWVVRSLAAQRPTLGRFRLLPGGGALGPV
jgi:hypothetical protein